MQEAEAYAEDSVKKARERADATVSEAKERATDITLSYSEKAEREAAAIIARASSSADILERNILLDAKSLIIDGIYEKAEKELLKLSGEKYFTLLKKNLLLAIESLSVTEYSDEDETEADFSDTFILTLNAVDNAKYGERLIESVKTAVDNLSKSIELSENFGEFSGGLMLRLGNIEISATLDTLIKGVRAKTETDVYSILFR